MIVSKSNQIIDGGNKSLVLKDGANCPMIIVGDAQHTDPEFTTENVYIKNFVLDGNFVAQPNEIWNGKDDGIRNNGITIRRAKNITIENCIIKNCRSGGIVIEKSCDNVVIKNCILQDNFFDGIAAYISTNCVFSNNILRNNRGAGMSFDCQFSGNKIDHNVIIGNDIGVFMRWCDDNKFIANILQNHHHDLYFNQRDDATETFPKNYTLEDNISTKDFFGK